MPLYVIERNFAEQIEATKELADEVRAVNADESIRWLYSFLSTDKKKSYCLYEAANPEAIRRAAQRLNIPADVIIAVDEIRPEAFV
jgi:hypothetical protein